MKLAVTPSNSHAGGGLVSEEARTGKRFPLHLPIKFHKAEEGGEQSGVTGNLSAAGVYIKADAALEVGSNVEFEIALPPEMTGAKDNVIVQCRGRVVRKDEGNANEHGVACVIDSYDFVRHE